MFKIELEGKLLGYSELESGDPPMGCVSGNVIPKTSLECLESKIKKFGAVEDSNSLRLELDNRFKVYSPKSESIEFQGGCIWVYPGLKESWIDLVGIGYPKYLNLFPNHVKEYDEKYT